MIKKVVVVKNGDISKAVGEAVGEIGLPAVKDKKVLIKPNCNSPDKFPGTTNPEVVVRLIELCQKAGANEIIVADKSSIYFPHSTERTMKIIGLWDAVQKTKAKIIPFDQGQWVQVKPKKAIHWPRGFKIPQVVNEAEVVISVPVIHTHIITGISFSLKNSVGIIDGWNRKVMHISRDIQEKIAEINLAYNVDLVVLDGSKAFIAGGPNTGELVTPNTIVVSQSRVQADIMAYKLIVKWGANLPMPPESHPQIAHAIKIGIE